SALVGGIEVDRVDVLVLLGRVLRVLDGTVRPAVKPFGVLLDPWMIRRSLNREVERDLQTKIVGGQDEAPEGFQRSKVRMDSRVPAGFCSDSPGTSDRIVSVGGIAGALAVGLANRMNRRKVDHVEAKVAKLREAAAGLAQSAGAVGSGPLGAHE